jgi:hypothetical protein
MIILPIMFGKMGKKYKKKLRKVVKIDLWFHKNLKKKI